MIWTWDDAKNRANKLKHGLSFETARLVFDDPLATSKPDPHPDGDRWQTIGTIAGLAVFVVHTFPQSGEAHEETGRIIGARKATSHERKAYEEGYF